VRSPAKINLGLSVGPPRPDGFHPVATVYQAVALYDDVTAVVRDDDASISVEVVGDFAADVPTDETNLAVRAARLLQAEYDVEEGVELTVRKTIPVAGGMAGGSTDAAATLVACNRLWGLQLSQTELQHLAGELGSDVPFCLVGHTALGRGRGEQVTEVMSRGTFHWVFAIADGGLSTPAVYGELDRLRPLRRVEPPQVRPELLSALLTGQHPPVRPRPGRPGRADLRLRPHLPLPGRRQPQRRRPGGGTRRIRPLPHGPPSRRPRPRRPHPPRHRQPLIYRPVG
jgi:4-diphosphocytidyl-2-C-methyl-D-erythritol kinase